MTYLAAFFYFSGLVPSVALISFLEDERKRLVPGSKSGGWWILLALALWPVIWPTLFILGRKR